jgi:hypothetical protein
VLVTGVQTCALPICPQYPQTIKDLFQAKFHKSPIAVPSTLNGIEEVKVIIEEGITSVAPTPIERPKIKVEV